MAIERIGSSNLAPLQPLIAPRAESGALALPPLATPGVTPLLPVSQFTALLPEGGPAATPTAANQGATPGAQAQAAQAPAQAAARDSTAMRDNQVFFSRQMVWQAPDADALASSWRVMVKTYGDQNAALQEQARGLHIPSSLLMAEQNPAALREPQRLPHMLDIEAWRFAVYGWGGQRMRLRLLPSDADEEKPGRQQRRRDKLALRLELRLPDGTPVMLQMAPSGDGVLLELATPDPAALAYLRAVLPQLAQVMARSGLRIVRCRIGAVPLGLRPNQEMDMRVAAAALTPELFRAMAEAALFLSGPPVTAREASAAAATLLLEQERLARLANDSGYDPGSDPHAGVPMAVAAPMPELIAAEPLHGDWKWED